MNDDAQRGMDWWNDLNEAERRYWLEEAGSAVPADAWEAFKLDEKPIFG